jgi:hypothetical protein
MKRKPWSAERRAKFMSTINARVKPQKVKPQREPKLKKDGTPRKKSDCGPRIKGPSIPVRRCVKCISFQLSRRSELTGECNGTCHAHPPRYEMGKGIFPPVLGNDWCHEWSQRP